MASDPANPGHGVHIDPVSGQSTTGHEWDGISELNNPLPKWWLYVFYICIAWSLVYFVFYPAIPMATTATKGILGYSSRVEVEEDHAAIRAARGEQYAQLGKLGLEEIFKDTGLRDYAMRGGEYLFKENCAPCHQSGGAGAVGYPNLTDDEWLWGGSLAAIEATILHGIRNGDNDARASEMPAFGRDQLLDGKQIEAVAEFVLALAEGKEGPEAGRQIFAENCASCHSRGGEGVKGEGNPELGAPALNNRIWLRGGDKKAVVAQIKSPVHGVMPAWKGRLSPTEIKQLSIYVHTRGGGQ